MAENPEIIDTLSHIGLSEKEVHVYVALAELESGTAYQIALACDVKKPTVYVILEDLRKKGLVLKIPHAKKNSLRSATTECSINTDCWWCCCKRAFARKISTNYSKTKPATLLAIIECNTNYKQPGQQFHRQL